MHVNSREGKTGESSFSKLMERKVTSRAAR